MHYTSVHICYIIICSIGVPYLAVGSFLQSTSYAGDGRAYWTLHKKGSRQKRTSEEILAPWNHCKEE